MYACEYVCINLCLSSVAAASLPIHLNKSAFTYTPGKDVVEEGDLCLNTHRAEALVKGIVRCNHKIR